MLKPNTIGLGEYSSEDLAAELNDRFSKNTSRVEVIDHSGRVYVEGSIYGTPVFPELSIQDNGRTLKIFVEVVDER